VDRCALFVDAGYVLADGAMAVHGTRHRESVSWNYPSLLQFLGAVARDRSGLPLLRCYWYEATVEGRRSPEHETLADLPGVKLRLGRMRPGRREGVESEVHRDLITLARNGAIADALVVSAEEELAQVIAEVQDLGVRVILAHIAVDGKWTISRALRQECDDIVELTEAHLRPYVDFVAGAEPVRDDEQHPAAGSPGRAQTNGHGQVSQLGQQAVPAGAQPAAEIYTAPVIAEYQRSAQPIANGQPGPLPSPQPAGPASGPEPGRQVLPSGQPAGPGLQPGMTAVPGAQPAAGPGQTMPVQHSGPLSGQVVPPRAAAGPGTASPAQQSPQPPASLPQPVTALPGQQPGQAAGLTSPPGPSQPGPAGQPGMPPGQPGYPAGYASRGPDLAAQPGQQRAVPGTQQLPAAGQPGGGPQPGPPQPQVPLPPAVSMADAVQAAHREGFGFGQAVAREAPQLWLEAVLTRKPRMPSDLEARLLQDSALPIDSLLHDEVRHALRRGFWDALERSRH